MGGRVRGREDNFHPNNLHPFWQNSRPVIYGGVWEDNADCTLRHMNQYHPLHTQLRDLRFPSGSVTALFRVITQRVMVNPYRRFGTTYQSHLDIRTMSTGTALTNTDSTLHLTTASKRTLLIGMTAIFFVYGRTHIPLLLPTCISNDFISS
jgi:hypothetical protein